MRAVLGAIACTLVLAGCGAESDEATAPGPGTVTVTETATAPTTTASPKPPETCSTAAIRVQLADQDLPAEVASVRRRIFDAAVACDYTELQRIALERGEGFTYSYGGSDSAAEHWRTVEQTGADKPLLALVKILSLPYTRNESGSYAWPSAYNESPSDADWQAVVDAGVLTAKQVEQMKTQGTGYLGYRTAITPDGDWQFFVAGD